MTFLMSMLDSSTKMTENIKGIQLLSSMPSDAPWMPLAENKVWKLPSTFKILTTFTSILKSHIEFRHKTENLKLKAENCI